jgi:hypothetical protein
MNNKLIAIMVGLGILGMGAGIAAKSQPKVVVIDKCKKKKSGVKFNHAKHTKELKVKCKQCHHKGKNKACASAGCHVGKAAGKKPGCAEMSMKKNPFHITCVGCHKKNKKGPKKCKECHK